MSSSASLPASPFAPNSEQFCEGRERERMSVIEGRNSFYYTLHLLSFRLLSHRQIFWEDKVACQVSDSV